MRTAIAKHPDILSYAQGLWKALGRSQQMQPETVVHYCRYLTQLQWWSAERGLGKQIQRIALNPTQNPLESFSSGRAGRFSMQFRQYGEVSSTLWIFNLDVRCLHVLAAQQRQLSSLLNLNVDPSRLQALYPLRLQVEAEAIPSPVSPLTLAFDTPPYPGPAN